MWIAHLLVQTTCMKVTLELLFIRLPKFYILFYTYTHLYNSNSEKCNIDFVIDFFAFL